MRGLLAISVVACALAADVPSHPGRIIISEGRLTAIRAHLSAKDPYAIMYYEQLMQHYESFASLPPVKRPQAAYAGILDAAREVLDRIYTAALLYRLDGNSTIGQRGVLELLNCTRWSPDWNPKAHFLDTAELMHATGVGYDSFYALMSDSERQIAAHGISTLGLEAYLTGVTTKQWWVTTTYNWGGVCNGGAIVGALALLDDPTYGDTAAKVLGEARQNIEYSMQGYGPDGLWKEGCMYEDYQTRYIIAAVNALETAQGSDGGLSNATGYDLTCESSIHCSATATKLLFDWSDSHESVESHSNLFELGQRFNRPACPEFARIFSLATANSTTDADADADASSSKPLGTFVNKAARMLLYYSPLGSQADIDALPLEKQYNYGVYVARRSWNYTDLAHSKQAYFGFKGGSNTENHGHLDLGSVVFDSAGHRFLHDLGADSYALPDYFGNKRWSYYRLGTWGHNTLTFDGDNQNKEAAADIVASGSKDEYAFAVMNLTDAYAGFKPAFIMRGASLAGDRQSLVVRDEMQWLDASSAPKNMSIRFHTYESVQASCYKGDGSAAVDPHVCLSYFIPSSNRTITVYARIVSASTSCPGASWVLEDVRLEAPQEPTDGLTRISVTLTNPADVLKCTNVAVTFGPQTPDTAMQVPPLDQWAKDGPLIS